MGQVNCKFGDCPETLAKTDAREGLEFCRKHLCQYDYLGQCSNKIIDLEHNTCLRHTCYAKDCKQSCLNSFSSTEYSKYCPEHYKEHKPKEFRDASGKVIPQMLVKYIGLQ